MLAAMNRSLIVTENGPEIIEPQAAFEGEGDTLINVSHSSVNYKDAMALSGNRGILRELPTVPGIDAVGTLEDGTLVTVNGRGIGERRHGGYTPQMRIDAKDITRVPERFSAFEAAAIGTAGYTAALSVAGLERVALSPLDGPVLVTGATGGVGSIAVNLLRNAGYEVHAMTGRPDDYANYLHELGAHEIIDRAEFTEPGKPLQKAIYAGAVDTSGSQELANVLARTKWGGTVAATGMASGPDLPATVMPFILRNVHLAGVNSVDAPLHYRQNAWQLLARTLDLSILESLTNTLPLEDAVEEAQSLINGSHHGRTVLKIS